MINILTDSIADIPKELLDKYNIETIPMYVQLNGKMYQDGENIDPNQLFSWVQNSGKYPTTSAPPPADFMKFLDRKEPTIFIGVSGQLSTTMGNAQIAVNQLGNKRIDLIDSKSISIVYGQIVLQAAQWRNEGMGFEDLSKGVRDLVDASRGIFILDSLEYLYHGGRCSAINHFASSLLSIRPFLNLLPDGTLGILGKVRGSRNRAINKLFSYFKDQKDKFEFSHISIGHLNCGEEVKDLETRIHDLGIQKDILISEIGCVLASHSGPRALGITYTIR